MTGNGTHGKGRRAGLWIAAVTVAVLALAVVFLVLPAVRRQAFRTVGSVVTFGSYPQQAQGTDRTPIQWQVLDVQGDRALLLSCRGLDTRQYHTEKTETTWAACSLRAWLNGEFLNRAFSGREQAGILATDVDNGPAQGYGEWKTEGGDNTRDRVFLLSCAEAEQYLGAQYYRGPGNTNSEKAQAAPTAFALQNGAWRSSWQLTWRSDGLRTDDERRAGWWWLRSPGSDPGSAAYIFATGGFDSYEVNETSGMVRPAIWLDLKADIF